MTCFKSSKLLSVATDALWPRESSQERSLCFVPLVLLWTFCAQIKERFSPSEMSSGNKAGIKKPP